MVRPALLRIPEGIELPPQLIENMVELIGPYGEPVTYNGENDVIGATRERMSVLNDAFTFMMGAYGSDRKDLIKFAEISRQLLAKEISSDASAKTKLSQYTQILVDILCEQHNLEVDDAIKQLNRAEQYYTMTQQRPNVATLSTVPGKSDIYLLQYDNPIQAFAEKTIAELEQIKLYSKTYENHTPEFPQWFDKTLSPQVQVFIINAKTEGYSDSEIRSMMNVLSSEWKKYASHLDSKTIECIKKYSISNDSVLLPKWVQELPELSRKLLADYFTQSVYYPKELERQRVKLSTNPLPETYGLPAWYFFLNDFERVFLVKSLDMISDLRSVSLSSRLRSLPGIANGAVHGMKILDKEGNVLEECKDRYRGAHIVSRDNYKWPMTIQGDYVGRNLSMLADHDSPLYITTLISPSDSESEGWTSWLHSLALAITKFHPDTWLHSLLDMTMSISAKWNLLNFPVNYLGGYLPWKEELTNFFKSLWSESKNTVSDPKLEDLGSLIREANELLDKKVDKVQWNSVNLRLAAIYHLIGLRKGTSFGSCVSGKDRYAVLMAYVDAMMLYKFLYGIWPGFHNSNNVIFNNLFMSILMTNHQAELAHRNAYGARGLKNLHDYLTDIVGKEHTVWLKQQDQMASTNDVDKIIEKGGVLYQKGMGQRLFHCTALGEDTCRKINDQIYAIVQEKAFWLSLTSHGLPTGIDTIRELFAARPPSPTQSSYFSNISLFGAWVGSSSQKRIVLEPPYLSRNSILVLADVLNEIWETTQRSGYRRDESTQRFYDILSGIENTDFNHLDSKNFASELEKFHKEIKEKSAIKASVQSI